MQTMRSSSLSTRMRRHSRRGHSPAHATTPPALWPGPALLKARWMPWPSHKRSPLCAATAARSYICSARTVGLANVGAPRTHNRTWLWLRQPHVLVRFSARPIHQRSTRDGRCSLGRCATASRVARKCGGAHTMAAAGACGTHGRGRGLRRRADPRRPVRERVCSHHEARRRRHPIWLRRAAVPAAQHHACARTRTFRCA